MISHYTLSKFLKEDAVAFISEYGLKKIENPYATKNIGDLMLNK
jgi:hypothetical protein